MANRNSPRGLVPFREKGGGTPGRSEGYAIADQLAQNLFTGDPVTLAGAADAKGRATITIAGVTDTSPILGVFQGCKYRDINGEIQFSRIWRSGTETFAAEGAVAIIAGGPNTEYLVQVDDTAGLVAANVGQAAPMVSVGTGNTATGISAAQLDQSNIGTAGQFYIVGLSPVDGGNEFGQFADAIVLPKTFQFTAVGQAGV